MKNSRQVNDLRVFDRVPRLAYSLAVVGVRSRTRLTTHAYHG